MSDFDAAVRTGASLVVSAPGRVNLIGEHTDYNGGAALPFAIDRRTTLHLRARPDRRIRVRSTFSASIVESSLDAVLGDEPLSGWSAYLLGVARVFGSVADLSSVHGFDALVTSNIPVGVGVSSSHALECATAVGLSALWSLKFSRSSLIALTQRVEHEVVGSPTGTMDQSAILLGQADHAVRLDFSASGAAPELVPLGFERAGLELLVMDSTERHDHATGGYGRRRAECEEAARLLEVPLLGSLSLAELEAKRELLPEVLYRRARHIVSDTERVAQIAALLTSGRAEEIGPLLTEGHASERDDFEISTPALDAAVAAAVSAGALGARLTGGGFGGAAIALVHTADAAAVAAEVRSAVVAAGHPEPTIFPVKADAGVRLDPDS